MKLEINLCRFFLFILFVPLLVFPISAQDFRAVRDGIEYAEMTRGTQKEPIRINLLKLDLKKVRLDVAHALDAAIGLEKTSSIAKRHGAFAAINAGFFRLGRSIFAGDATSVLQIDGKLLSESFGNRIALGIINGKNKTDVLFGHLKTDISISTGAETILALSGINRERRENEIIVLTPEFARTTLTNPNGTEFIVKTSPSNPSVGKVTKFQENKGSASIPTGGYIISASGDNQKRLSHFFSKPAASAVKLNLKINALDKEKQIFFSKAEDIVGGVPQLIKNGKIEITWQQEKISREFVETRHPRTAIALLKDGKILMVTVDGRQPDHSVGMNLQELAALLLELGAIDAMNLDGGGSTTMFLDGKVVNKPSDKEGERSVGDAILVFPR